MKKVLIFSGTTEGRKLAETLAQAEIPATVCVATEYGKQVMPLLEGVCVHQGRMDLLGMQEFIKAGEFFAAVDATHPFATEVSKNIRESAGQQNIPYFRLKRETKNRMHKGEQERKKEAWFSCHEECAKALEKETGNILLTTGSKNLEVYCKNENLKNRLYARVLPSAESLEICDRAGLKGKQILAMQGPFSEELNLALIRQFDIRYLVTKESGITGGFTEKALAAEQAGIRLCVIGNPEKEEGFSFSELCVKLEEVTGIQIPVKNKMKISLVGVGMGGIQTLTKEAADVISCADYLFGAKRLLDGFCIKGEAFPYYLASDILPVLEQVSAQAAGKEISVAVLFSGDSGFYSGCENLYHRLLEWKQERKEEISIRIYPGISSVSYFAAACGMSWQDGKIVSVHGKGGRASWEAELLEAVRYHEKTFLLVSGAQDVREVGCVLREAGLLECKIILGYQLSYREETIKELTPAACEQVQGEGLYICAILHKPCEKKYLAPEKTDLDFLREEVPMTKEEVRQTAICKLHLTEGAVVYDIGSGTGSVAVEIADRSAGIKVFAIEQKAEAAELIRRNIQKFHTPNVTIISAKAPEGLRELPAPTHVFLGGTGGNLSEILDVLREKNPAVRVVMTAVSLETVSEITKIQREMQLKDAEVVQLQVSRAKTAGNYQLMRAENPVYIFSFGFA